MPVVLPGLFAFSILAASGRGVSPIDLAGGASRAPRERSPWRRRRVASVVLALSLTTLGMRTARAEERRETTSEPARTRGTWAGLLAGYAALSAITVGAAYLTRDNFVGRSLAVSAAGWGGVTTGAVAGYGLSKVWSCTGGDCAAEEGVATAAGALIGGAAASLAGVLVTSHSGMSRPYTTAAGLAPLFIYLTVGTIADW